MLFLHLHCLYLQKKVLENFQIRCGDNWVDYFKNIVYTMLLKAIHISLWSKVKTKKILLYLLYLAPKHGYKNHIYLYNIS